MRFEKYQAANNEWRWRLIADNNTDIIADSGEGYGRERDCDHGIALVKAANTAPVVLGPKVVPLISGIKPIIRPLRKPNI